jgi:UPF0716 protein FxsA
MRVLLGAIAVLILVPTAEITVLLKVGHTIGAGWTVLLLLASAFLGSWALRREGTKAFRAWQQAAAEGRAPARETAEGLVVIVGGLLMILPGFLTDLLGLSLLLPPVRKLAGRAVLQTAARRLPPDVSSALLGPMQVRSRRVKAAQGAPYEEPTQPKSPNAGTVIEGEIAS